MFLVLSGSQGVQDFSMLLDCFQIILTLLADSFQIASSLFPDSPWSYFSCLEGNNIGWKFVQSWIKISFEQTCLSSLVRDGRNLQCEWGWLQEPEPSTPKSMKQRGKIVQHRFLEPCWLMMISPWSHLGPRWSPLGPRWPRGSIFHRFGVHFGNPKYFKNGFKNAAFCRHL